MQRTYVDFVVVFGVIISYNLFNNFGPLPRRHGHGQDKIDLFHVYSNMAYLLIPPECDYYSTFNLNFMHI